MSKPRKILKKGIAFYKKKGKFLTESEKKELETLLEKLDQAILSGERDTIKKDAQKLELFSEPRYKKNFLDHFLELIYALIFAIVIAFVVRQFWFELYEVPTGSMRPSIEELDRLIVSKTAFGIKIPFKQGLWLYSPERVKRNGMIVFSAQDLDIHDTRTVYFLLFPGYKQFVKRCLGKPGDTLYFYGGRIYGVDKKGHSILEMASEKDLEKIGLNKIEHIPVITFDGKYQLKDPLSNGIYLDSTIMQMNSPVARMEIQKGGKINGQFFNGNVWTRDDVAALKKSRTVPVSYSDLWGIGNYAMCRLLNRSELHSYLGESPSDHAPLYLELRHTPNTTFPKPLIRHDERGRVHAMPTPFTSVIPLNEDHLNTLFSNLYTSRFVVKNGKAYRYQKGGKNPQPGQFDPSFEGVPNGIYEFYYGKGYRIYFGGIVSKLPSNHPLYDKTSENIQRLYNLGVGLNTLYTPMATNQPYNPQRFAYFRDGELFTMGAPLLRKEDPTLKAFVKSELNKQRNSSEEEPYIAFVDHGPPLLEDGEIDVEFIKAFGLKMPENGILALGDNYANSSDSRDFGPIPENNLRGTPSFIFWPFGRRFGTLPQPAYPWFTWPNMIVWVIAGSVIVAVIVISIRNRRRPLFRKK
ncbi:MAG: signal peptidase I [Chlamydiia bacterium]|nr:signal peptidase I [Chlamydiia bacterium]